MVYKSARADKNGYSAQYSTTNLADGDRPSHSLTERLPFFRCVDSMDAYLVLHIAVHENGNLIAVQIADDRFRKCLDETWRNGQHKQQKSCQSPYHLFHNVEVLEQT